MGMYRSGERQQVRAASQPGAAEAWPRIVSCYRVAKLVTRAGPMLCLVRALSDRIVSLDIDLPFAAEDSASLEIGRVRLAGALVRTAEKKGELRSRETIDAAAVLADPSQVANGGRRTLPRIEIDARCRIDAGAHRTPAEVRDISTDGIKIFTDELLSVGDEVRIVLRGFDTALPGVVRWCSGDYAGIEFHQRLPIGRLNQWLALQSGSGPADEEPRWTPPVISKS